MPRVPHPCWSLTLPLLLSLAPVTPTARWGPSRLFCPSRSLMPQQVVQRMDNWTVYSPRQLSTLEPLCPHF